MQGPLSLITTFGGPNGKIVLVCKNFWTVLTVARSVAVTIGDPVRLSIHSNRNRFSAAVLGTEQTKSINKTSNKLLCGGYKWVMYGFRVPVLWQLSKVLTFRDTSLNSSGCPNLSAIIALVATTSRWSRSFCKAFITLFRSFLGTTTASLFLIRWQKRFSRSTKQISRLWIKNFLLVDFFASLVSAMWSTSSCRLGSKSSVIASHTSLLIAKLTVTPSRVLQFLGCRG